jgi:hypothetical protein
MTSERDHQSRVVKDQSFEAAGGAAEVIGLGLDGLSHAGPLALIVGLLAVVVVAPVVWLRRRGTTA